MGGFTPYQRRLFIFLSVATFFEGYDFLALSQVLPEMVHDMGITHAHEGLLVAFINLGTVVAYLLVRQADKWGRKRVLTVTILGYTLFTFLTGLAPDVISFALFQFFGRVFLIAEWAISMVYAAEEFPAERRGLVIGVISAFSSFGAIVCAGVAPILIDTEYGMTMAATLAQARPEYLVDTMFGWRMVYFVGVVPLLLLAFARRGLKESKRYVQQGVSERRPLLALLRGPYRKRIVQLALIWGVTYICSQTAVTFWKQFVMEERGFSKEQVGQSITLAALIAMPLIFVTGALIDKAGRRLGGLVIFGLAALGTFGAYTMHSQWALTVSLVFGIFGASAPFIVLNAYTTELFPTEIRGDAYAWANNLLGRIGYVVSPLIVGVAAETWGWGASVRLTAICPLLAVMLVWVLLPETRAKELEETSAL